MELRESKKKKFDILKEEVWYTKKVWYTKDIIKEERFKENTAEKRRFVQADKIGEGVED